MAGQLRVDEITDEAGTGSPDFINGIQVQGTQFTSSTLGGNYVMQTYTSPATWTKPAGLKAVKITLVAGGGGGGGVAASPVPSGSFRHAGFGGAARDSAKEAYLAAPSIPGPVAVTVGAGGAGGVNGPAGTSGGTSSFGAFISATGGAGGAAGVTNASGADGATGGVATGPAVVAASYAGAGMNPQDGSTIIPSNTGAGWGINGVRRNVGTKDATGIGAGGGGGQSSGTGPPTFTPADTGGAGAPGIVIIEEFY